MTDSDPRVFFAAERTLLAWVRTGLTLIALGFVVARFGLFMRLLAASLQTHDSPSLPFAAGLGVLLVLIGSLAICVAAVQQQRFVATLAARDLPPAYSRKAAVWLALGVAALGFALAGYLGFTTS